jgi:D-galactarolactone isomerase
VNTHYEGACDCHVHIYEDGYPLVPNAAWVPRHSPVSAYRAEVQEAAGLQRVVIVQPAQLYGF